MAKWLLVQSRAVLLLWEGCQKAFGSERDSPALGEQMAFGSKQDSPALAVELKRVAELPTRRVLRAGQSCFWGKSSIAFGFRTGQSCFWGEVARRLLVQSRTVLLFGGSRQMAFGSDQDSPAFWGRLSKGFWFRTGQSCFECR